jgi:hypothetical protein
MDRLIRLLIISILAIAVWLLFVPHALAAPTPFQARSIWYMAWGTTYDLHGGDRTILNNPPQVLIVPQDVLCPLYDMETPCPGLMALTGSDHQVLIADKIDFTNPVGASVLYHEFIHVLQRRAGRIPTNCRQANTNEYYARVKHAMVLNNAGESEAAQLVMSTFVPRLCEDRITPGEIQ